MTLVSYTNNCQEEIRKEHLMDSVNDIIDMLKDRLVEATRNTNRVKVDLFGENKYQYTYAELYEAEALEEQLRSILFAITGKDLFWHEDNQAFSEQ